MVCPRSIAAITLSALLLPVVGRAQSFCEPVEVESTTGATVLGNGTPGSISTAPALAVTTPASRALSAKIAMSRLTGLVPHSSMTRPPR